jgi:uncharacterized protein YjbI with pentapeptide repeats
MASAEQIAILKRGPAAWNGWRRAVHAGPPDLSKADLRGLDLHGAHLRAANLGGAALGDVRLAEADLRGAFLGGAVLDAADLDHALLKGANLIGASLRSATLRGADLRHANLRQARLDGACLAGAHLTHANLHQASLVAADLTGADLTSAQLVETHLQGARLPGCRVYGVAAWNVDLTDAVQTDLIVTNSGDAVVTVDDIEVAQLIHLALNSAALGKCIDTVASKLVLILGRFSEERKSVLDAIRTDLRERGLVPVVFDFEKPARRGLTETVATLAHLARLVIADITDARSVPYELGRIVPHLPSVPLLPILHVSDVEYALFADLRVYPWVLPVVRYDDRALLLASIRQHFGMR